MSSDASLVVKGSVYTFAFGDTVFAVDAAKAGRIADVLARGQEHPDRAQTPEDNNWGSTFWPSPQSDWSWPPPAEIDPGAYTAQVSEGSLLVSSAMAPGLGLAVSKRFSVDVSRGAVHHRVRHRQPRQPASLGRAVGDHARGLGRPDLLPDGRGRSRGRDRRRFCLCRSPMGWPGWLPKPRPRRATRRSSPTVARAGSRTSPAICCWSRPSPTPRPAQAAPGRGRDRALHRSRPDLRRGREPGRLRQARAGPGVDLARALVLAQARPRAAGASWQCQASRAGPGARRKRPRACAPAVCSRSAPSSPRATRGRRPPARQRAARQQPAARRRAAARRHPAGGGGSGGATSGGGATGTGGVSASGGTSSGGTTALGGATSSGGVTANGGSTGTNGRFGDWWPHGSRW